jgi:aspartyl-tRNA(Asn)/glutamyl-tRNA(Gln) amidotransferase subunit B
LNRAGIALLEIVTAPDLHSSDDASEFAHELQLFLRSLGVCSGNMHHGCLRFDINLSIRPVGDCDQEIQYPRVEVKNVNSLRHIRMSVESEIARQIDIINTNGVIQKETRCFDAATKRTVSMRNKSSVSEYMFLYEPDIPPVDLSEAEIAEWSTLSCELPSGARLRYRSYGLDDSAISFLLDNSDTFGRYVNDIARYNGTVLEASKWLLGDIAGLINEKNNLCKASLSSSPSSEIVDNKENYSILNVNLTPARLISLVELISTNFVTGRIVKSSLNDLLFSWTGSPREYFIKFNKTTISDENEIRAIARQALSHCISEIERYKAGDSRVFEKIVGQVMSASDGRADIIPLRKITMELIDE